MDLTLGVPATITFIPVLVSPAQSPCTPPTRPRRLLGRGGRSATSRASRAASPRCPPGSGLSWRWHAAPPCCWATLRVATRFPPGDSRRSPQGWRTQKGPGSGEVFARSFVSQTLRRVASSLPPGPPGDSRVPTKVRDLSQNGSLFFSHTTKGSGSRHPPARMRALG